MNSSSKYPRSAIASGYGGLNKLRQHNFSTKHKNFHREKKLPSAFDFYKKQFPKLHVQGNWATARCCFHDDRIPSLVINMKQGYFKCFSCDAKGGGIVDFHIKRTGLPFRDAIRELEAWG